MCIRMWNNVNDPYDNFMGAIFIYLFIFFYFAFQFKNLNVDLAPLTIIINCHRFVAMVHALNIIYFQIDRFICNKKKRTNSKTFLYTWWVTKKKNLKLNIIWNNANDECNKKKNSPSKFGLDFFFKKKKKKRLLHNFLQSRSINTVIIK